MNNPGDQLNEEQSESPFGELENEHEFEAAAGFAPRSVTGGKGPGMVENEGE